MTENPTAEMHRSSLSLSMFSCSCATLHTYMHFLTMLYALHTKQLYRDVPRGLIHYAERNSLLRVDQATIRKINKHHDHVREKEAFLHWLAIP